MFLKIVFIISIIFWIFALGMYVGAILMED